jgi:hypothetical protein
MRGLAARELGQNHWCCSLATSLSLLTCACQAEAARPLAKTKTRAASGAQIAAPPRRAMNSRRLTGLPRTETHTVEMGESSALYLEVSGIAHVRDGSFATQFVWCPLRAMSAVPRKLTLGSSGVSVVTGQ